MEGIAFKEDTVIVHEQLRLLYYTHVRFLKEARAQFGIQYEIKSL